MAEREKKVDARGVPYEREVLGNGLARLHWPGGNVTDICVVNDPHGLCWSQYPQANAPTAAP